MTSGKFNLLDAATIKISVNGKSQIIDMAGPKKLDWLKDKKLKVVNDDDRRNSEKEMDNGQGALREPESF